MLLTHGLLTKWSKVSNLLTLTFHFKVDYPNASALCGLQVSAIVVLNILKACSLCMTFPIAVPNIVHVTEDKN